jgi:hypothetical protein
MARIASALGSSLEGSKYEYTREFIRLVSAFDTEEIFRLLTKRVFPRVLYYFVKVNDLFWIYFHDLGV